MKLSKWTIKYVCPKVYDLPECQHLITFQCPPVWQTEQIYLRHTLFGGSLIPKLPHLEAYHWEGKLIALPRCINSSGNLDSLNELDLSFLHNSVLGVSKSISVCWECHYYHWYMNYLLIKPLHSLDLSLWHYNKSDEA